MTHEAAGRDSETQDLFHVATLDRLGDQIKLPVTPEQAGVITLADHRGCNDQRAGRPGQPDVMLAASKEQPPGSNANGSAPRHWRKLWLNVFGDHSSILAFSRCAAASEAMPNWS